MTYFWAKTTADDKPGLSVHDHLMNVGYVAQCTSERYPGLLHFFRLDSTTVAALSALHDLGKISPGFQGRCESWLAENGLAEIARNGVWDTATEKDHGKVTHAVVQEFLMQKGVSEESAQYIAAILGAHHGRLKYLPNPRGIKFPAISAISTPARDIDWNAERYSCAESIWNTFKPECRMDNLADESPTLWWLAGLTSVADWIGSDERYFSPERRIGDIDIASLVASALSAIGFKKTEFVENLSFHDLFHDSERPDIRWVPNEMQEQTLSIVSGPGVYVIEAPMGMGKTEAALWAAYRLLVSGQSTGIYFALPTQATSNRMHLRMKEFMRRISPGSSESRLIHANSWLIDQEVPLSPDAANRDSTRENGRAGRDWFSSAKRALIAAFGVGTVDQALLGVVAAKHFFVRHFALAGKIVILDEVHSYDLYTGTLIDKLITTLEALGCTVIILSATLSGKRLRQITEIPGNTDNAKLPYPLITGRHEGNVLEPAAATPPEPKTVKVDFIAAEKAAEEAIALARKGGAVLWICNTISAAQKQHRRFKEQAREAFPIGLVHARFPYWRREMLEDEWMERFGKAGTTRCGSILVSTQVVEQSVDLDADLMITELAPTDMLLQRLGRLWRHERGRRPADAARLCIIEEESSLEELRQMKSKAIATLLGGKGRVYAPYVLLRSLEVWKASQPQITVPVHVRRMIEATYADREKEPDSWQQLYNQWFGSDSAKRMKALMSTNLWQPALEDVEGDQTRINEVETIPLVLCRNINQQEAMFIDNTKARFGGDKFLLASAQAIHRNLVRVPVYCFERIESCAAFADYIYGKQTIGLVTDDGATKVNGLKDGIRFYYSDDLGLVIEKAEGREAE